MKLRERLLNLLFPPKCPFCGRITEESGVCGRCRSTLPWAEGAEGLRTLPGPVSCAAPLFYEGAVREGILRFKFRGASGAADALGALIAQCAAERFSGEFDTVTWVPVSAKRLRRRGYDQARLLAEAACRRWDTAPEALLKKCGDNPAQSGLSDAAARRANVLGMYDPADPARIRERRILLIDDVCTTGATLAECARTLREAGAQSVVCAAVALRRREEQRDDSRQDRKL